MSFTCDLSCPLCAGPVNFVAKSAPDTYHAAFVVGCLACKREMVVKIDLVLTFKPDTKECGSEAGYARHIRRNEDACPACKQAHTAAEQQRRFQRGQTPGGRKQRELVNA